jgi:hypothetical protein
MQMLETSHHPRRAARALPSKRGRRREILSWRGRAGVRGLLVLLSVGALTLIGAATADAHIGTISIDCETVTFAFTRFPTGSSQIDYAIRVDGTPTSHGTFTVTGASATQVIANHIEGDHTVSASASWSVDRGGSAHGSAALTCEATAPAVAPAPAPAVAPAPAAPPAPAAAPTPAPAAAPPLLSLPPAPPPTLAPPPVVPLVSAFPPSWTSTTQLPQPAPPARCKGKKVMVEGKCVVRQARDHSPVKQGNTKKKKHIGVLGAKKTKNLPFTK